MHLSKDKLYIISIISKRKALNKIKKNKNQHQKPLITNRLQISQYSFISRNSKKFLKRNEKKTKYFQKIKEKNMASSILRPLHSPELPRQSTEIILTESPIERRLKLCEIKESMGSRFSRSTWNPCNIFFPYCKKKSEKERDFYDKYLQRINKHETHLSTLFEKQSLLTKEPDNISIFQSKAKNLYKLIRRDRSPYKTPNTPDKTFDRIFDKQEKDLFVNIIENIENLSLKDLETLMNAFLSPGKKRIQEWATKEIQYELLFLLTTIAKFEIPEPLNEIIYDFFNQYSSKAYPEIIRDIALEGKQKFNQYQCPIPLHRKVQRLINQIRLFNQTNQINLDYLIILTILAVLFCILLIIQK